MSQEGDRAGDGAGIARGERRLFKMLASASNPLEGLLGAVNFAKRGRDAGFSVATWKNYTGGIATVHAAKKPGKGAQQGAHSHSPHKK